MVRTRSQHCPPPERRPSRQGQFRRCVFSLQLSSQQEDHDISLIELACLGSLPKESRVRCPDRLIDQLQWRKRGVDDQRRCAKGDGEITQLPDEDLCVWPDRMERAPGSGNLQGVEQDL